MTPYREYLAWLARQDTGAAAAAWAQALAGLEEPTLLAPGTDRAQVPVRPDTLVIELPGGLAAALERHARGQAVTVNTVMQAAWAMLAGALTGRDDVVFGAVVAGRPAELPGVETMLGLFINTVPVRVRLDPALTAGQCGPGCRTSSRRCWPTTIWAWRRSSGQPGRARSSTPWSSTRTTPLTLWAWAARFPAGPGTGHRRRRAQTPRITR